MLPFWYYYSIFFNLTFLNFYFYKVRPLFCVSAFISHLCPKLQTTYYPPSPCPSHIPLLSSSFSVLIAESHMWKGVQSGSDGSERSSPHYCDLNSSVRGDTIYTPAQWVNVTFPTPLFSGTLCISYTILLPSLRLIPGRLHYRERSLTLNSYTHSTTIGQWWAVCGSCRLADCEWSESPAILWNQFHLYSL